MNRSKKVYDKKRGIYVYVDRQTGSRGQQTGSGIFDVVKSLGKKFISTAAESGSKKLGDEVGKMAAEKIVSKVKVDQRSTKSPPSKNIIMKELNGKPKVGKPKVDKPKVGKPKVDKPKVDMNLRINKLLSGGRKI